MPDSERRLLSGWGGTAPTSATVVTVESGAAAVSVPQRLTTSGGRGAIARGLGRSYGDAAQNAGGTVLDMTAVDGLTIDQATGTAVVGAGTSLDALMRVCVPLGWWVPVTPGTRQVTIGGAIGGDVHGKNHHVDGSFAAHVPWLTLALPDGSVRRLTPADALFHATTGGMGLTGVILEAGLALMPISTALVNVDTDRHADLDSLMAAMVEGDSRFRYSVAWVDAGARGTLGRGVLTRGDHATYTDVPERQRGLVFDPRERVGVPALVPRGLLSSASITAFNEAWFRRAPERRRGELQQLGTFFHPLDGVRDWNRLYGPRGFVQYQFVVPDDAASVVRVALERLRAVGATSFLSVLKRFGAQGPGHLSFPMPGWTLALDIPAVVDGLAATLDSLDELVASVGGRVYLAKDSRMSPAMMESMYPRLEEFRALRATVDPHARLNSDLARRLHL